MLPIICFLKPSSITVSALAEAAAWASSPYLWFNLLYFYYFGFLRLYLADGVGLLSTVHINMVRIKNINIYVFKDVIPILFLLNAPII